MSLISTQLIEEAIGELIGEEDEDPLPPLSLLVDETSFPRCLRQKIDDLVQDWQRRQNSAAGRGGGGGGHGQITTTAGGGGNFGQNSGCPGNGSGDGNQTKMGDCNKMIIIVTYVVIIPCCGQ